MLNQNRWELKLTYFFGTSTFYLFKQQQKQTDSITIRTHYIQGPFGNPIFFDLQ